MPGITSKLPEGWERSETNTGIPYYINHETERTQWDHPEMVNLMEEIDGLNNIKYAAYRTAMKLRAIQKKTQLYMVDLPVIIASLDEEGIRDGVSGGNLSVAELLRLVTAIFINQNGDLTYNMDVSLNSELVLNWLLNVYDPGRTGFVQIVSVKVGLAVMCSAKVQDKYRYMFRQFCGNQRYFDKRKLKLFLLEMLEIPKYIYESTAFSGSSVEPAIRNCFERVSIPERVSAEEFIEWMTAEPQTIVWLPTLHRLAVSETVKHEAKCNVCKMYPIVGFRYRCLKCFNFDLCQECFWSGRVNKQHKIGHPTQEYCLVSTQKEDIKAFAKVMKNKVSKKKKRKPEHPSKGRFIPLGIEDAAPSDREEDDYVDAPSSSNVFPGAHDKLGNYAARLADHESQEDEEEFKQSAPLPRPSMDDEHHLIRHYAKGLSGEPEAEASPFFAPIPRQLDSKEKQDLEDLITALEDDNRTLLGEIANIHALQRHSRDERAIISVENSAEASFLRQQRERLQAREEVLEAHNHQLQIQLHRLRILLQQEEATLSGLITDEENMAVLFANERVKQITLEAKKKARMGDLAQIASFMKSNQASKPLSSAPALSNATVDPLTSFPPSKSPEAAVQNKSSAVVQPPSNRLGAVSSFPPDTFLSGSPNQTPSSKYFYPKVMSPPKRGADWQSQSGEFWGANISHGGPMSAFSPKTAAELGLLDRPDSSLEEMEMSNIVDRMTAAFPLDHNSDIPVDVHSDLFLAASLVGEALQSMVTTVSRASGGDQSRRSMGRNLVEPHYGHDNLGFGDWPRADPEEGDRLLTGSLMGYEYGPL